MLPGHPGKIPDLVVRGPEYYQDILVIFRTSADEVRNITRIFGSFPDLVGNIPLAAAKIIENQPALTILKKCGQ